MDDVPPPPPPPLYEGTSPAPTTGMPRGRRRALIAIVIVAVVVIGIIGYAIAGVAFASSRVAAANRSLNTVVSHQNDFNSTFNDINSGFTGLSTSTFDHKAARALYDRVVASATLAATTIDRDDAALVAAKAGLGEQPWLTLLSKGSLDKEAQRIDHARKALVSAKSLANDQVLDGQFFQVLMDVMGDLDAVGTQTANADLVAAKATLVTMKTHVDNALQLSMAPGLPVELHDLMVDFQALVTAFGKLLDAIASSDVNGITGSEQSVEVVATKIANYDYNKIAADIGAYYKPRLDTVDSEMKKATA